MNFTVNPKASFVVEFPYAGMGIINAALASGIPVDVYYVGHENFEAVKTSGQFKDPSQIRLAVKGKRIFSENMRGISPKGYFIIVNNSDSESKINLEVKEIIPGPLPSSISGLTGFGTSAASN